jgi:lipopolysaccharide transport system permease protein
MAIYSVLQRFRSTAHFVRQDLVERYRNDFLGMAWLVIQPLILIVLFSVVFSSLMRARLPGLDPTFGYTVYLITGILAWNAFAQTLSRLSGWYRDKAGLYRKLALGLYVPAFSVVVSEFLIYCVAMALFAVFLLLVGHPLSWQWLWLPLLIGLFMAFGFGLGLILGLLEVFIPDIRRAVPLVLQLGFWLTPIVYTLDILPSSVRQLVELSPVTLAMHQLHQVVVFGEPPRLADLLWLLAVALLSLALLRWLGQRLKKVLRDAL